MGNKRKELNARLGDYAANARLATAATTLRGRFGNWPIYAAAVGSALAMSTSASANIISGPITGATVSPTGQNKSSIKGLLLFGEVNLRASSGILTSGGYPVGPFAALRASAVGPTAFIFDTVNQQKALNFTHNAVIDAGAGQKDPAAVIVAATFTQVPFGNFTAGVPGYVGLAFKVAGGYDYGWLEVEYFNGLNGAPQTLEALAYGVNDTPNAEILAGQVPEPGTMGLALLATGAFGVAALRRRRKHQAEPAA